MTTRGDQFHDAQAGAGEAPTLTPGQVQALMAEMQSLRDRKSS